MENPFEKKPVTLIIALGALVVLILGAGIVSTYYSIPNPPDVNSTSTAANPPSQTTATSTPPATAGWEINFERPYSISWNDGLQDLIVQGSYTRKINVRGALAGISIKQMRLPQTGHSNYAAYGGGETVTAAVLKLKTTLFDPLMGSNYYKICNTPVRIASNMRRVVDESGQLEFPYDAFIGTANECIEPGKNIEFDQDVIFPIRGGETEFTFTTGSSSEMFFFVEALENGSISVEKVPQGDIPG